MRASCPTEHLRRSRIRHFARLTVAMNCHSIVWFVGMGVNWEISLAFLGRWVNQIVSVQLWLSIHVLTNVKCRTKKMLTSSTCHLAFSPMLCPWSDCEIVSRWLTIHWTLTAIAKVQVYKQLPSFMLALLIRHTHLTRLPFHSLICQSSPILQSWSQCSLRRTQSHFWLCIRWWRTRWSLSMQPSPRIVFLPTSKGFTKLVINTRDHPKLSLA